MEIVGIGTQNWKSASNQSIDVNNGLILQSESDCTRLRRRDPVPFFRDYVLDLSNGVADKYARSTREVVNLLRNTLLSLNESTKAMLRSKENLETALENIRKDLQLNRETAHLRSLKPKEERLADGADDLLNAERLHLVNLKQALEAKHRGVDELLQQLAKSRAALQKLLSERGRVCDLVCGVTRPAYSRQSTRDSGAPGPGNRPSTCGVGGSGADGIDALGSYTPQCEMVIKDAEDLMRRCKLVEGDVAETLDEVKRLQKTAHKSVNDGLVKKISETVTFDQKLELAAADSRRTINKARRWESFAAKSLGYNLGPEKYSDLKAREKLDRPIIRVYQRHPGNQVPEAQEIIKARNYYEDSLLTTRRNIGLLQLSQRRLEEDMRAKKLAASADLAALRNRRKKADHRW
ncbi:hypothetical protein BOX15_Mlig015195g1 [Macrostomum lignano]|uniref:Uncharacterized protein n=2 Tax=Macrostomum lignano TaxID=282301 RepID=A0A267F1H5_9PLAT|nr:hypothetical protein BOX15_Mlig026861g1 [Macrostomum lignano]PAA67611.1 hypothetical protein BOX15_Mlig015195g1 [Macrostomum lignano]